MAAATAARKYDDSCNDLFVCLGTFLGFCEEQGLLAPNR